MVCIVCILNCFFVIFDLGRSALVYFLPRHGVVDRKHRRALCWLVLSIDKEQLVITDVGFCVTIDAVCQWRHSADLEQFPYIVYCLVRGDLFECKSLPFSIEFETFQHTL